MGKGTLTVAVANYNHAKYLAACLESCLAFADVVRVYDDASTDASLEVIRAFPEVILTQRDTNSGSPVWGSSQSILDCDTTHLAWVDADNFMLRRPETTSADYTFFDMMGTHEDGSFRKRYKKHRRPTTYPEVIQTFLDDPSLMPFPWGGVWRTEFLAGKCWLDFDCAPATAPDYRTSIEWVKDRPTLRHIKQPFLAVRSHQSRMSCQPERLALCKQEAALLAARMTA